MALALALALAGCSDDAHGATVVPPFQTEIKDPSPPPSGAVVTGTLQYERNEVVRDRLDLAALGGQVDLDPALVAGLGSATLVRIVQVSDAQLREERARLLSFGREVAELPGASLFTPAEQSTRPSLLAANSPFVWLGMVLTVNALHQRAPVDVTLHTGDAVDVNLRSELWRFLEVGDRLETPMLMVAGNHDVHGWGVWRRRQAAFGTSLDEDVEFERQEDAATFVANRDQLIMAPLEHQRELREVTSELGAHPPTLAAFGSRDLGYDLAPTPDALHYTVVLVPPVRGVRPGVQLIVLETNRDDGGGDAELDDAQLDWLRAVLDAPSTRENVVIVTGHHPIVRDDPGTLLGLIENSDLDRLREVLLSHPNVAAYLTGHTHVPEVDELLAADGSLALVQINPGALLLFPQTAALIELSLDGADLVIDARRFGTMIAPGSDLAARLAESAAAAEAERPRAEPPFWDTYRGRKPLPAFPAQ